MFGGQWNQASDSLSSLNNSLSRFGNSRGMRALNCSAKVNHSLSLKRSKMTVLGVSITGVFCFFHSPISTPFLAPESHPPSSLRRSELWWACSTRNRAGTRGKAGTGGDYGCRPGNRGKDGAAGGSPAAPARNGRTGEVGAWEPAAAGETQLASPDAIP